MTTSRKPAATKPKAPTPAPPAAPPAPAAADPTPEPTTPQPAPAETPTPEAPAPETPTEQTPAPTGQPEPETPPAPEVTKPEPEPFNPATAPLTPPLQKVFVEPEVELPTVASTGVHRAVTADDIELYDYATRGPLDPETMFEKPWEHANYLICQVRIIERVFAGPHQHQTERLLLPRGAQVTYGQAEQLKARVREINARVAPAEETTSPEE